jgi:hypothetical protein
VTRVTQRDEGGVKTPVPFCHQTCHMGYGGRMASVRRHLAIDAPAADVWRLVGAAERLHDWFPISGTVVQDPPAEDARLRGALAQRWITLDSGLRFEEDIVTWDHDQMRFQYRIVNNPLITEHLATVDVLDDGPQRCVVVYSTDMEPGPMALVIAGAALEALHNLRRMFSPLGQTSGTGVG